MLNLITFIVRLDGHYHSGSGLEGFFVFVGPIPYYVPVEKNPEREVESAVYTIDIAHYFGEDNVSQIRHLAVVRKIRAYCAKTFPHIEGNRLFFRLRESQNVIALRKQRLPAA